MAVKRHPSRCLAQGFLHGRVRFLFDGVFFDEGAALVFPSLIGLDDCVKKTEMWRRQGCDGWYVTT
jgi:hypothetical protein